MLCETFHLNYPPSMKETPPFVH